MTHSRFLRLPEVLARVGMKKSAVYAWVREGRFPAPVTLSARCVVWPETEIEAWQQARLAERDAA